MPVPVKEERPENLVKEQDMREIKLSIGSFETPWGGIKGQILEYIGSFRGLCILVVLLVIILSIILFS